MLDQYNMHAQLFLSTALVLYLCVKMHRCLFAAGLSAVRIYLLSISSAHYVFPLEFASALNSELWQNVQLMMNFAIPSTSLKKRDECWARYRMNSI